ARRQGGGPGSRHLLALGGEAVPGAPARGRRSPRAVRHHDRTARAVLRIPLERAAARGDRPRPTPQDRVQRAGPVVRPPPPALRERGAGLREPGCAAHGRLLELLRQACRHAGTGAPSRLADGVLHPRGAPRAAALSRGSEPLDGPPEARDPDRGGWLRGGVLRAAAAPYG